VEGGVSFDKAKGKGNGMLPGRRGNRTKWLLSTISGPRWQPSGESRRLGVYVTRGGGKEISMSEKLKN